MQVRSGTCSGPLMPSWSRPHIIRIHASAKAFPCAAVPLGAPPPAVCRRGPSTSHPPSPCSRSPTSSPGRPSPLWAYPICCVPRPPGPGGAADHAGGVPTAGLASSRGSLPSPPLRAQRASRTRRPSTSSGGAVWSLPGARPRLPQAGTVALTPSAPDAATRRHSGRRVGPGAQLCSPLEAGGGCDQPHSQERLSL